MDWTKMLKSMFSWFWLSPFKLKDYIFIKAEKKDGSRETLHAEMVKTRYETENVGKFIWNTKVKYDKILYASREYVLIKREGKLYIYKPYERNCKNASLSYVIEGNTIFFEVDECGHRTCVNAWEEIEILEH